MSKKVTMFMFDGCPHCRRAWEMIEKLRAGNPAYKNIEIERIDERLHPDIADKFDYYYVPTFYVGGKKLHEGVPTEKAVKAVLDAAIGG